MCLGLPSLGNRDWAKRPGPFSAPPNLWAGMGQDRNRLCRTCNLRGAKERALSVWENMGELRKYNREVQATSDAYESSSSKHTKTFFKNLKVWKIITFGK